VSKISERINRLEEQLEALRTDQRPRVYLARYDLPQCCGAYPSFPADDPTAVACAKCGTEVLAATDGNRACHDGGTPDVGQ
jgi:hypothetical protein